MRNFRITIRDMDDATTMRTTLAAFARDNRDDPEAVADVARLKPGEHIDVGGGAQPHWRIRRTKPRNK